MTFSIYAASVPVFTHMLVNLRAVLEKAQANATERKISLDFLVNDRLAPDMLPLKFQIQSATDHAKFVAARLSGRTPPAWADDELSFDDLKARVSKALEYLKTTDEASFAGADTREVSLRRGGKDVTMPGSAYFLEFALPNFYFHYTTAYAILRKNGMPIGKRDYLG